MALRFDPARAVRGIVDRILEPRAHLGNGLRAPARILDQATLEHTTNQRRRVWGQLVTVGFRAQHRGQSVGDGLPFERSLTGQHLVEQRTERPDVRAPIDVHAARLLWTHVCRGAEDRTRDRSQRGDGRRRGRIAPG